MAMNIPAPVQILRATQAEIAERTGANGELNWAEDMHELYIHDGTTKGGHLIAGNGGGSTEVTAGDGISVTGGEVAVDDTVVRTNKEFQTITGSLLIDGVADSNTLHDGTEISKLGIVSCVSDPDDTNVKAISTLMPYRLGFSINKDISSNIDFSSYDLEVKEDGNYGSLDITANYPNKVGANAVISLMSPKDVDTNEPFCTAPSTRSTPVDNEIITYDFLSTRYLPISGGTLTGGLFGTAVALSGDSIDVSQGSCFTKTITAATTFVFTGVPSNATACFSLVLTNGGSQAVTWPSSVKWSGGANPELAASGVDVFTFFTADGGTTWYGVHSVQGAA